MSAPVVFPVDYQTIVSQVMDPEFHNKIHYAPALWSSTPYYNKLRAIKGLEDYGHPVGQNKGTEFDESRGYTAEVYGWKMFCDEMGPFEEPHYLGNLYDAENGLGYIGYITEIGGKPYPTIHHWAERTRIRFPGKGRYEIDKTEAIYDYESSQMC
jgi:hypothetical protein